MDFLSTVFFFCIKKVFTYAYKYVIMVAKQIREQVYGAARRKEKDSACKFTCKESGDH